MAKKRQLTAKSTKSMFGLKMLKCRVLGHLIAPSHHQNAITSVKCAGRATQMSLFVFAGKMPLRIVDFWPFLAWNPVKNGKNRPENAPKFCGSATFRTGNHFWRAPLGYTFKIKATQPGHFSIFSKNFKNTAEIRRILSIIALDLSRYSG